MILQPYATCIAFFPIVVVPYRNRMHFCCFFVAAGFSVLFKKGHKVTIDERIDKVLPGYAKSGILYNFQNEG